MFAFPATLSMSAVRPPMFAGPMLRHSNRSNALSKGVFTIPVGVSSGLGEGEGSCAELSAAPRSRNRARLRTRFTGNILLLQKREGMMSIQELESNLTANS